MPLLDTRHSFGRLRVMLRGRPYWQLSNANGTVISEWQGIDWKDVPFEGRATVSLFCPNGERVTLGSGDGTGRLFQFKVAHVTAGESRATLAHVIGHVIDNEGNCIYAAWDTEQGKLVRGTDNVYSMAYHQTGHLSFPVMGLRF